MQIISLVQTNKTKADEFQPYLLLAMNNHILNFSSFLMTSALQSHLKIYFKKSGKSWNIEMAKN